MVKRRDYVQIVGATAVGIPLAGCSENEDGSENTEGGGDDEQAESDGAEEAENSVTEVEVGPEKRLRFAPDAVEISVGDTVKWIAKSQGHNVTSRPEAASKCENPDGAEPFQSYDGDDHFAIMEVDETFEHEFTVPGEYVYVCVPHAGQGMVGSVTVTE